MTDCTHHCRGCGSHFTSLAAFDRHRGKRRTNGRRTCNAPSRVRGLVGSEGRCATASPLDPKEDVRVYGAA